MASSVCVFLERAVRLLSYIVILVWALSATFAFVLVRSWCIEAQDALVAHLKDDVQRQEWQNAAEDACVKELKDATEVGDNCVFALRACLGAPAH